jgi:enoyl-CoA hydratase/carnithine racemase
MAEIKCERPDDILVVTMMRGKANALNLGIIEELNAAVDEAACDDAIRGVVLASNRPRFFSSGFDATEVFRYDRETMTLFFSRFIDLYESLYLLPKPVVAAVSGHAYAGGAILALSCDFRILAKGNFGFALNEINLGMVLPPGVIRMAVSAAGPNRAREMLLFGDPITPARALEIGLAYSLAEPEAVLETATLRCSALAQKPRATYAATKHSLRGLTDHSATGDDKRALGDFIEQWFSEETESRKQTLLKSLVTPAKE